MKREVLTMLVLSRKCQEAVVVGGAKGLEAVIRVTVLEIEKNKVRLGFEAAENIPVNRLEVWERLQASAQSNGPPTSPDG
jgi:carbon storage regulator CsrA